MAQTDFLFTSSDCAPPQISLLERVSASKNEKQRAFRARLARIYIHEVGAWEKMRGSRLGPSPVLGASSLEDLSCFPPECPTRQSSRSSSSRKQGAFKKARLWWSGYNKANYNNRDRIFGSSSFSDATVPTRISRVKENGGRKSLRDSVSLYRIVCVTSITNWHK